MASAFFAGFGSLLIVLVLLLLLPAGAPRGTPEWLVWMGLLFMLGLCIWANAEASTPRGRKQGVWIFNMVLAFAVIVLASSQGAIPRGVAKVFGIRIEGDVELRVASAACKTIMSTVQLASREAVTTKLESDACKTCRDFGNRVTAQVEVRLGTRWLVRVRSINGMTIDQKSPRVTIPDLGTELLVPVKSTVPP